MLKHTLIILLFFSITLNANNFRNGMIAYKNSNYAKAKILLEMALEKDKVYNASHILGKMYLNGNGVEVDLDKAIEHFKLAYKYGNITAGCYASKTYIKKGVFNWGILEDWLARGLKKRTRFCMEVVDIWQNK